MYNEWISHWARRTPGNVAVVLPGSSIRYAEFDAQIDKVAARLAALGLAAGNRAAVLVADEYAHWLAVLALDRIGVASASIAAVRPDNPFLAVLRPDLLVTTTEARLTAPARSVRITREWLDETMRLPPGPRRPRRSDGAEIVRYFSSSGTTGWPKIMALTRAQVAVRIDAERLSVGAGKESRACVLVGPGNSGGYTWALGFWSVGGSVVLNVGPAGSIGPSLRRTMPSHLYLAVGNLVELVRDPAAIDLQPMPSLSVLVVGSALPKALAAQARKVLSPNIATKYGATEVAGIALGAGAVLDQHDGTAAWVLPSAEVEAVDGDDRVLAPGATGFLRIRTLGMVAEYLNEAPGERASSTLRGGWFYPGDLGSVSADGLVIVAGRASEVMNIGGDKYAPQALEELALTCAGIRDAAAFSVPDKLGVETPWIAVVRGADHKPGELVGKLGARWPQLGGIRVAVMAEIPRNQMGKIDRQTLRQQGEAAAAAER